MNIMLIGPNQHNATDGVIVRGIRYLLNHNYKDCKITYVELIDDMDQCRKDFHVDTTFDLIVVCGTPWLWDNFQNSIKFNNLVDCFFIHLNSKKLFMGIGSCLLLQDLNSNILSRPEEQEAMRSLFYGATVITRDHLAQQKLTEAGVKSTQLPCPAYFCYENELISYTESNKNILIWADPQQTISKVGWQDPDKLLAYYEEVIYFYHIYKPKVYCTNISEIETAERIGLPSPILLTNSAATLSLMRGADKVLSGRVHCAVPARIQKSKVKLIPIDTRSYVISDYEHVTDFSSYKYEYNLILQRLL